MRLLTDFFLAWRYFKPKRNAVSVITIISVAGVSIGVCVLMVVLAIMTGFTTEIKTKIIDTRPHIQIQSYNSPYIRNPDPMVKRIDEMGAVAIARTQGEVLVQSGDKVSPQFLIGVDVAEDSDSSYVKGNIISGQYSLENGEILVSYVLANQLGLRVGDKLVLHSPSKLKEMVKFQDDGTVTQNPSKVYLPTQFTVAGIYNVGEYSFDSKVLISNIDDANELFGYPLGAATMISVKTPDAFNIDKLYGQMEKEFARYQVLSWKQLNKQFLDVLAMEKNMMFFVLVFIVLVAASSITNTLITVVVQKTREIGLLAALGATPSSVMRVFILQGFFVGTIGTFAGLISGGCVIYWRNEILRILSAVFHIEIFPRQFYFLSQLPAQIVTSDLVFISVCSIALCTLGAVIPAFRASRLDPAKALRYE